MPMTKLVRVIGYNRELASIRIISMISAWPMVYMAMKLFVISAAMVTVASVNMRSVAAAMIMMERSHAGPSVLI
jgi:hypothetical protein